MVCWCTIKMSNPCKKKRQARWQSCPYCDFRSGKNKVFQKHVVTCRMQQQGVSLKASEILPFLNLMRKQFTDQLKELSGRIAVLEESRGRNRCREHLVRFWRTIKPNEAWDRRKKNAIRIFRAILSQYEGPSRMFPDIWQYFKIYVWGYGDVSTMEIIKSAIWPVLRTIEGKTRIYDVDSDEYQMSKRIWGKAGLKALISNGTLRRLEKWEFQRNISTSPPYIASEWSSQTDAQRRNHVACEECMA